MSGWMAAAAVVVAPAAAAAQDVSRPRVQQEVPVSAVDLVQAHSNNSPAVAADPTEPRFLAVAGRLDLPQFGCSLHVSGDGGRGWLPAQPVPRLPAGAERCYAPEVSFDSDGVLYYLFVGLAGAANRPVGVFLTTSSDRGRSFSPPWPVLGPGSFQVRMAIDPTLGEHGRIHLAWLSVAGEPSLGGLPAGPNPIVAAHSDDGGRTFSRPVQVSDPERARVVAPALAVGADHVVHVAYYDLGDDAVDYQGLEGAAWDGVWSLVSTRSSDAGRRFSPGVVADDAIVPPGRVMLIFTMAPPALAADPAGRVHLGWHDARNGDWDVFVRRSLDAGRTWQAARRLNDDPPGNGRHQYLPRLSASPNGRLDAAFYDRRHDADNVRNDVFYTSSVDGGEQFRPNLALTSQPSDSRVGPKYPIPSAAGLVDFGSRLGLASTTAAAYVAWTDTRNSLPGEQQDLFATEVAFADRPTPANDKLRLVLLAMTAVAATAAVATAGAAVHRRAARRDGPSGDGSDRAEVAARNALEVEERSAP